MRGNELVEFGSNLTVYQRCERRFDAAATSLPRGSYDYAPPAARPVDGTATVGSAAYETPPLDVGESQPRSRWDRSRGVGRERDLTPPADVGDGADVYVVPPGGAVVGNGVVAGSGSVIRLGR
jgi:hypothetical protein